MIFQTLGMKGRGFGFWLSVAASSLFLAGGALGFLSGSWLGGDARREEVFVESPSSEVVPHVTNDDVYESLELVGEQRVAADRILGSYVKELKRLREEHDAVSHKVEADFLAILDAAQQARVRELRHHFKIAEVAERASQKVYSYKLQLKLTPVQEREVYPIFLADQLAKEDLLRSAQPACGEKSQGGVATRQEEFRRKLRELDEDRAKKLRPVLTSEQFDLYQKVMERRRPSSTRGGSWKKGEAKGPPVSSSLSLPLPVPAP